MSPTICGCAGNWAIPWPGTSICWASSLTTCPATGAEAITITGAIAWAGRLPDGVTKRPATRASTRLTAIRGFAAYLHTLDPVHEVPPRSVFSRHVPRPTPHIYTRAEVTALIEAAGRLNGGVRARTCSVLFGLLAATGLRIGEALALDRDEADLETGVLTISRGSKSRDPRLVPLHPTATAALNRYRMSMRRLRLLYRPGPGYLDGGPRGAARAQDQPSRLRRLQRPHRDGP